MNIHMKQHLSVLGLFARSSLLRVLAVLLAMGGAEIFFFGRALREALVAYRADIGNGLLTPERLLDYTAVNVWFAAAFLLITLFLCLPGCEFGAHTGYTLRRLSVSENTVFLWQTVYNILIYLLLAAAQTLISYGLCLWYTAAVPAELVSNQTVFLAFYRSELLHALLPLADLALWIRNLLLLFSLGLAAALFPCKQRERRYSGSIIALVPATLLVFERGIGEFGHTAIAACICLMVVCEWVSFALVRGDGEGGEEAEEHA